MADKDKKIDPEVKVIKYKLTITSRIVKDLE